MKQFVTFILGLLVLTAGCKKKGCLESSGNRTIQVRKPGPFNEIYANDNINIVLRQDTLDAVTIEAGSNLQQYIQTDCKNGQLTLRNNSACSWLKGPSENITAYISFRNLTRLYLYGSGNVSATTPITGSRIYVDAYQAVSSVSLNLQIEKADLIIREENADFTFTGEISDSAYIFCGMKGTMDCRNLKVRKAEVDQRSIRDMYVWTTDTLLVSVEYKGNVYYKGNPPAIQYKQLSDGRLLPLL